MGSRGRNDFEEPRHRVRITRGFYLGTTPVTQEQFAVWKPEHKNGFPGNPTHPAEEITWQEALGFCAWLNDTERPQRGEERLPEGYVATLPTEAEWEYACCIVAIEPNADGPRVITANTAYYTGEGTGALAKAGWYGGNAGGRTHAVTGKLANGAGLCDMHGNVWEWCWDAWDWDAYKARADGAADPVVDGEVMGRAAWLREGGRTLISQDNPVRVGRGGSWIDSAGGCRSAFRIGWWPGNRGGVLGFRVCLVPGPDKKSEVTGQRSEVRARLKQQSE